MKKVFAYVIFLSSMICSGQSDLAQIEETLQTYLNGSSHSEPEVIQSAFYSEAPLFLSKEGQEIYLLSPKEYADLFKNREKGKFNGREGKILTIDQSHNIAMAKAEIRIPNRNMLFIDIFLLKKLEGKWKIISKAAALMPE
ncbi:MAG: nuclear transport factor 2 family protein [Bacteroidota bacterium]